jgi:hypothetical protein
MVDKFKQKRPLSLGDLTYICSPLRFKDMWCGENGRQIPEATRQSKIAD